MSLSHPSPDHCQGGEPGDVGGGRTAVSLSHPYLTTVKRKTRGCRGREDSCESEPSIPDYCQEEN